ncbi:MAG: hypothetical protein AB2693_27595, partial [Candidatus Thiodiazotropha sp.]
MKSDQDMPRIPYQPMDHGSGKLRLTLFLSLALSPAQYTIESPINHISAVEEINDNKLMQKPI